ncbi:alpha-1,4-glucan--maltose-1-phosphate maltosyltransferase [Mucilaginibacter sp. RS28]|uniref:Alpha-1,4-glucan:maltose-1-phosphate maltosyltransferase n=1 Tax=Mucilaginibacter straminoryzae TaxID=2932774 RepID=A0A9X2BC68_9SPHI|nr:alpha-1,4-glucan--maltose-1-phosphate maltosyltransferase [Mucilaginibacter straminoryzae]MCJ8210572.1 alpha-1,4-glucan--maltose-1-phosphate maltosyltransferase [Mucilaginibacter straminoryzae]
MISSGGKQRVIITDVNPRVEDGLFPAKAVLGERLKISASIFGDGHDEVAANAYIKHESETEWAELPMQFVINDYWEATFQAEKLGFFEFRIEAWEDHYTTWKKGLKKKFEAGQDVAVEIQIGIELLEDAAAISPKDKEALLDVTSAFKKDVTPLQTVTLALSDQVAALMYAYRHPDMITVYPATYRIEIERKKAAYSTWYELFPRSTSEQEGRHGTFKDVTRLLPRVAHMGFDVLYFPPIHPIGEKNRKGKNNSLTAGPDDPGSPWAIGNRLGGHKAIHPELGTLDDFKALVAEVKKYNIEIAMDIAYQCAPDHPYVKEHPQWFKWRPDGTVQYAENPPKKYEDILPFNFETDDWENLWQELKSVIEYWIAAGITIFRIDNPHTKAFAFWQWMIGEVRQNHPEVLFLAEAFTRPRVMERLGKAGFNQSYTYFTWRNTKYELQEYMHELTRTEMRWYYRPNFWPNTPDILPPILTYGGENAHIMRLILAATLSSNYGLYGPVYELGLNTPHGKKEEYVDNEKYEIKHWDWHKYTRTAEVMTRLNRIRKQNPALQSTWNIEFADTTNYQLICYGKRDEERGNTMIMAVNLDVFNTQGGHVNLPLDKLGIDPDRPYQVHDLLSGDRYTWQGAWNFVQLNPYQMPAHVFRVEQ